MNHMRQAIVTKYHGPGNVRGSRVKATAAAGSVILGWDDRLNVEENHKAAAKVLAEKFGWRGCWVGGAMPGAGYVFAMTFDREWTPEQLEVVSTASTFCTI